ncbi:MAG TPA: PIN domain-containing protein [Candidatus Nanoarchaeia archaeon]|nr:PIN domain-containing protein [Candidatus Nanoarchaeia archaeon]
MDVKSKNILVIIDTNHLGNYSKGNLFCKNYKYLEINKNLHENLVNNFNFKPSKEIIIQVAIPEIALEELKQQQNECFIKDLEKINLNFKKFKELQGVILNLPKIEYIPYLDVKKENYLRKYNITKINNPSEKIFPKLIDKVIKKQKPFYKKNNNQVDSGFKDALIWESILEFVSLNKYDKYFFLTNDSDFNNDFKQEFLEITQKELLILGEIKDLKGKLEEEIKGTKMINQSLENIEKLLLNEIQNIIDLNNIKIISSGNSYNVKEIKGYQIVDINLEGENIILFVYVSLEHESLYAIYAEYGAFDKAFINDTEISLAEIKLTLDKNYKIQKITSEEVLINGKGEKKFN